MACVIMQLKIYIHQGSSYIIKTVFFQGLVKIKIILFEFIPIKMIHLLISQSRSFGFAGTKDKRAVSTQRVINTRHASALFYF